MALTFKFIPLTFLNNPEEINKIIRNTIILKYLYKIAKSTVPLQSLIEGTQYGYNDSAKKSGKNKFLRISDIKDGAVDWETVPFCDCTDEETYLLNSKDILVARTGGTTGKSFMISEPPKSSIYAGYLIRIRANESTVPEYLNLFLNSYAYWSQIVSLNEDNFRPRVNAESLKSLVVPNCSIEIQNDAVKISNGEFLENYDELFEKMKQLEKCNDLEEEYKTSLKYASMLKEAMIVDAFETKTEVCQD
ncbi:MAG: hypothetical protein V9E90_09160 [Saprospiraceae bacterium]|jgi:type I restriction enzyme S subunit